MRGPPKKRGQKPPEGQEKPKRQDTEGKREHWDESNARKRQQDSPMFPDVLPEAT